MNCLEVGVHAISKIQHISYFSQVFKLSEQLLQHPRAQRHMVKNHDSKFSQIKFKEISTVIVS